MGIYAPVCVSNFDYSQQYPNSFLQLLKKDVFSNSLPLVGKKLQIKLSPTWHRNVTPCLLAFANIVGTSRVRKIENTKRLHVHSIA